MPHTFYFRVCVLLYPLCITTFRFRWGFPKIHNIYLLCNTFYSFCAFLYNSIINYMSWTYNKYTWYLVNKLNIQHSFHKSSLPCESKGIYWHLVVIECHCIHTVNAFICDDYAFILQTGSLRVVPENAKINDAAINEKDASRIPQWSAIYTKLLETEDQVCRSSSAG